MALSITGLACFFFLIAYGADIGPIIKNHTTMKHNLTTLILTFLVTGALAQNEMLSLPNGSSDIGVTTGGNGVAIGSGFTNPEARLHTRVQGTSGIVSIFDMENELLNYTDGTSAWVSPDFFIQARSKNNQISPAGFSSQFSVDKNGKIQSGFYSAGITDQLAVRNNLGIYASVDRTLRFDLTAGEARMLWESPNDNFQFVNGDNSTVALQLGESGQVGVNTGNFFGDHDLFVDGSVYIYKDETDETPYSLLIEGTAVAEEMYILLNDGSWGDFVFEKEYDLMPLDQLEDYLEENKHLPDFPSAAEVETDGLALGETERLLTIKVEELTLYILELKKEIDTLKKEIKED